MRAINVFNATNETTNVAVGFTCNNVFKQTLQQQVGVDEIASFDFRPVLCAFVSNDYQEGNLIKTDITRTLGCLWTENVEELVLQTHLTLTETRDGKNCSTHYYGR